MAHAFLSASGAPAWTRCHVKPWREEGLPDNSNKYAEEGTAAHRLLELTLLDADKDTEKFKGLDHEGVIFDEDMCRYVQSTVDYITSINGDMRSEQKLPIGHITGEVAATGTADCVIFADKTLTVIDLKYGMGVEVDAENNEQLLIYADAARWMYEAIHEIETVRMVISQPRLNALSIWELPIARFRHKIYEIQCSATIVLSNVNLVATPGEKQCKFCKAKSSCPEYRETALSVIVTDFEDLSQPKKLVTAVSEATSKIPNISDADLATCAEAIDLIETWCKGVRAELETRLFANNFSDHRFKLVAGKRGNRKFSDEEGVANLMEAHGVDPEEFYEKKFSTPAKMEKVIRKQNPLLWEKMQGYIMQSEGGVSVAPALDKRPALNFTPDFENIEFTEALIGLEVKK